jgi:hypothetical protein
MSAPPDLDQPCGEHFVYRDLIACGETWRRLASADAAAPPGPPFDNVPRVAETFAAMRTLCAAVLDPLVDRFGPIELTYAFASPSLTRRIPGRIAVPLDQHAGHELNCEGGPICGRLGLAVDLRVPGADSRLVAAWIIEHTPFDRLYFYGPDRPLHVSAGPQGARQITEMRRGPSGRLVPRVVTAGLFRKDGARG